MLRLSLSAVLLTLVAAPAFADDKKVPDEISCAVVPADKVSIKGATQRKMYADYKGRRYFFCCATCPPTFKKNPAKYAKGASIPIPKPKKG